MTGRPLSQEEERAISQELEDGEIDYIKLLSVIESESEDVTKARALYQDQQQCDEHEDIGSDNNDINSTFWDAYGSYTMIGIAVVLLVSLLSCVIPCRLRTTLTRHVNTNNLVRYQNAREEVDVSLW